MFQRINIKVHVSLVLLLAAAIISGCELADNGWTGNILRTLLKINVSCRPDFGPWDNTLIVENQATATIVQHQVRETRGWFTSTVTEELTQYRHKLPSGEYEVTAHSADGREWNTTVHFAGNNEVITLILTDQGYSYPMRTKAAITEPANAT